MYTNVQELLESANKNHVPLYVPIIDNECKLKGITETELRQIFNDRLKIMYKSAHKALIQPHTTVGNLITGISKAQYDYSQSNRTICGKTINTIMAYALSSIEVNASMGKICAAPTAGSSGIMPAVLFGLKDIFNYSNDELINSMITASGLGAIVTANATVAGAEGGCQAECGVAAAISAAAAVYLSGGSPDTSINAFSISIVNILGLVCDPIAGLVQIPCAQRNASQAINALISADLAMSGMVIPVSADEIIETMYNVGKAMPSSLRETAEGGIASTPSAVKIAKKIFS